MIRIELLAWDVARTLASPVRFAVFVDEQRVPAEIELDEHDAASLHAVAREDGPGVLGTGRLLPAAAESGRRVGHVGRMAVLREARGRGIGAALLDALIAAAASRGDEEIVLAAQVSAEGFYRTRAFIAEGPVYAEAGIAHRDMRLRLRA